jgi:DNA helicase IV
LFFSTIGIEKLASKDFFEDQSHFDNCVISRENMRKDISKWVISASGPKSNMTRVYEDSQRILDKMDPKSATVAFGKIEDKDSEEIYIGRQFISDSEKNILVVEWQRPAAAPYYKATQTNPLDIILKREIFSDKNMIFSFNDTLFGKNGQVAPKVAGSAPRLIVDANNKKSILAKFDSKKTGEIAEIIQTIDPSQYGLIELPLNHGLIIQGGPGTGKSVVALHRISWLLYNFVSELKSSDILVLGPNKNFINYIENLLPTLGNQNIEYLEISNLGPAVKHSLIEDNYVTKIKGDKKMSYLVRNALLCKIKNLDSDLIINKFYDIDDQRELNTDLIIPVNLVNDKINKILSTNNYSNSLESFRSWFEVELIKRFKAKTSQELNYPIQKKVFNEFIKKHLPNFKSTLVLSSLLSSRDYLLEAASFSTKTSDSFSPIELNSLYRNSSKKNKKDFSQSDVPLLDALETLLNGPRKKYRHLVVDEAQDLSPMQLLSIWRRVNEQSFTIVGDLAQSTGSWSRDSWDDVKEILAQNTNIKIENLEFGYRIPKEILDYVEPLFDALDLNIPFPKSVKSGFEIPISNLVDFNKNWLADFEKDLSKFINLDQLTAVISTDKILDIIELGFKKSKIKFSRGSISSPRSKITLMNPDQVKGLEFDAIFVVDPKSIINSSKFGSKLLFVSLTRSTRHLIVIHDGEEIPLDLVRNQVSENRIESN